MAMGPCKLAPPPLLRGLAKLPSCPHPQTPSLLPPLHSDASIVKNNFHCSDWGLGHWLLASFFSRETEVVVPTGRLAGPLFLHLLLGGQIDATGWAIVVTGWAFAHPVGMLEEALRVQLYI